MMQQLSADPSNVVFGLVRTVEAVKEKVSKAWPERKNLHIIHGDLTDVASLEVSHTKFNQLVVLYNCILTRSELVGCEVCIVYDWWQP